MITEAEIAVEVAEILARIAAFRQRLAERPEYAEVTAIGFLDVGLEAAQNAIKGGYRCMKSEAGLPPPPAIDYDGDLCVVEYKGVRLWGLV